MKRELFSLVLFFLLDIACGLRVRGACPPDSKQGEPIPVPDEGLPFCSEYGEFACCSTVDALAIKQTVNNLMRPECKSCYALLSAWKCAECHPSSGDFFHPSDPSCEHSTSIRFCADYCEAVFEYCKDIPFGLDDETEDPFYLNEDGLTADDFCERKIAEEGQCFRGFIPSKKDENCICEKHNCHGPPRTKKDEDEDEVFKQEL